MHVHSLLTSVCFFLKKRFLFFTVNSLFWFECFGAGDIVHFRIWHFFASTGFSFCLFRGRYFPPPRKSSVNWFCFVLFCLCCILHQKEQTKTKLGYLPVCAAWTQTELPPETSGTEDRGFSLRAVLSSAHDQWTVHQLTATSLNGSDNLAHKASFIISEVELTPCSYTMKHTFKFHS